MFLLLLDSWLKVYGDLIMTERAVAALQELYSGPDGPEQ